MTRIKDSKLAEQLSDAEMNWLKVINPVSDYYYEKISRENFSGLTVVCWQHVLPDTIVNLMPLVKAGARVRLGACNANSTDDRVAAWLANNGVEVFAKSGMSDEEYNENLQELASGPIDVISDMGGELIEAVTLRGTKVKAAMEATTTGVHRVDKLDLNFPVFNWNDIALKDAMHNRYHVGDSVWPVFTEQTNMGLFGRPILVIGFGPVGRGVAERARNMGGVVSVVEKDPVRRLEAQHFGCSTVSMEEGLASNKIIVSSVGLDGLLREKELRQIRDGAILFNVSHTNREIDVAWLDSQARTHMKPNIDRYDIDGKSFYLLNRGGILNLSPGAGRHGSDGFDPYTAIMLRGIEWILKGGADAIKPGFYPFPKDLELEVAQRTVDSRT